MKILSMIAMAVLAIALTTPAMAGDPEKTDDWKCEEGVGSFFNPERTMADGVDSVFSSAYAKCSIGGGTTIATVLQVVGTEMVNGQLCLKLETSAFPGFMVNEKGSITFDTRGTQCFRNRNGAPIDASMTLGFCGDNDDDAYTSGLRGEWLARSGVIDGLRVVGGGGDVRSTANHCAGGFPFRNSGRVELTGEIVRDDS